MFTWHKLGRIFDPAMHSAGRPWLACFAQAPSSLLFDDFIRMYFSCRPPAEASGNYVSYSAFVDLDRRDPTRILRVSDQPILPLGALGTFDEFGTYPVSVIRHGDRYRAYYAGWTRCESVPFNVGIGIAESDDAANFQRLGSGPVLPYSLNEPYVLSGPKIRCFEDSWHLFYIAGRRWKIVHGRPEPVYKIRHARSDDGMVWEKSDIDLIESRIEPDEAQASPDVFFANGRYHMFFCYRYSVDFRGKSNGYRIGYAWSTDLRLWTRDDSKAGIDVSPQGWDEEMISYPHVFAVDGKTYMAYLGNGVGKNGFGLALLDGELE